MTGLFVSTFYDSLKAQGKGYFSRKGAVYLFPFFETVVKNMICLLYTSDAADEL